MLGDLHSRATLLIKCPRKEQVLAPGVGSEEWHQRIGPLRLSRGLITSTHRAPAPRQPLFPMARAISTCGSRPAHGHYRSSHGPGDGATYAALDLGTNNCRLLIAKPEQRDGFRARPRRRRLLSHRSARRGCRRPAGSARRRSSAPSRADGLPRQDDATASRAPAHRHRACRAAETARNSRSRARPLRPRTRDLDRETEARLAAAGCGALADRGADYVLLFDIGGGSSEIVWLALRKRRAAAPDDSRRRRLRLDILALGVVTLAERFGGRSSAARPSRRWCSSVERLAPFAPRRCRAALRTFHLLGTSGTVTTIAGILSRPCALRPRQVDGLWLRRGCDRAIDRLRAMTFAQRAANRCIGPSAPILCSPAAPSSRRSAAPSRPTHPHRRSRPARRHFAATDERRSRRPAGQENGFLVYGDRARRRFGTRGRALAQDQECAPPESASLSSTLWLARQLNDPYVAQALIRGFRSRAAYKLIEIADKYPVLFKPASDRRPWRGAGRLGQQVAAQERRLAQRQKAG